MHKILTLLTLLFIGNVYADPAEDIDKKLKEKDKLIIDNAVHSLDNKAINILQKDTKKILASYKKNNLNISGFQKIEVMNFVGFNKILAFTSRDGVVYLSSEIAEWKPNQRQFIIAHEIAHAINRDPQEVANYYIKENIRLSKISAGYEEEFISQKGLVKIQYRQEYTADKLAMNVIKSLGYKNKEFSQLAELFDSKVQRSPADVAHPPNDLRKYALLQENH